MNSGIPVEIRGQYGEFYPGYIVDYHNPDSLTFRFATDNSSGFPNKVVISPSCLRKAPLPNKLKVDEEQLSGQAVEALVGKLPQDDMLGCVNNICPPSWWPAQVSKQRGDFIMLDFPKEKHTSTENDYPTHGLHFPYPAFEVAVEKSQVRPPSSEKMLSSSDLYFHVLEIPKDLVELFKDPTSIEHLIRICGQPMLICEVISETVLPSKYSNLDINDETKAYFLVLCASHEVIFKAQTLGQEIVRMLRQKVAILHQIGELSRRVKECQMSKSDSFICEEFSVAPDLIGQSIGARGANISRARAVDGVVSVVLNPETSTFKVCGKTKEAVDNARKVLEYATEVMQVPQEYVSRIIGQKNKHIQSLVDRVGLAKIRVQSADEATVPNCVPFAFTGTRSAINDARLLINFNIENLKEIDHLQASVAIHHPNRFDGDGSHHRSDRIGDGRQRPGGRRGYHTDLSDSTTFNGDGLNTSEPERYSDAPHPRPYPRRNAGRPPRGNTQGHHSMQQQQFNDSRQSSLPPPVPKSGVPKNDNQTNDEMSSLDRQKSRGGVGGGRGGSGSGEMARRVGRYLVGNGQHGSASNRQRPVEKPSLDSTGNDSLRQENKLPRQNGIPINAAT